MIYVTCMAYVYTMYRHRPWTILKTIDYSIQVITPPPGKKKLPRWWFQPI